MHSPPLRTPIHSIIELPPLKGYASFNSANKKQRAGEERKKLFLPGEKNIIAQDCPYDLLRKPKQISNE